MSKKDPSNRIAIALICDASDNVLMGQRNDSGKYTCPGGHLEKGEDAYEGMVRELKEEAGLDAKNLKIVRCTKAGDKILYLFKVEIDPTQAIDTSGDPDQECQVWLYIDPNEVRDDLHVPIERNIALQYWINS